MNPSDLVDGTASPRRVLAPPLWALLGAALLLGALGLWVRSAGLDTPLFQWINRPRGAWLPVVWALASVLGLGLSALVIGTAASPGRGAVEMRSVAALLWCLLIGGSLTQVVKWLSATPRPARVLAADQIVVVGMPLTQGAMPSGHALTAGVCVALCLLARRWDRPVQQAVIVLAVLVLLSRVGAGAHWPSDVLVGAALGLATGLVAWPLSARAALVAWLSSGRGQRCLGVGQLAAGVALLALPTGYPQAQPLQWSLGLVSLGAGWLRLDDLRLDDLRAADAPQPRAPAQGWPT